DILNDFANTTIGGIAAFSGAGATQPQRSSIGSDSTITASPWTELTAAFSSVTTSACDLVLIVDTDTRNSGGVSHAGPGGYTSQADLNSGFMNTALFSKDNVLAGEPGNLTV